MDFQSPEDFERFKSRLTERGYSIAKSNGREYYYKVLTRHYPDDRAVCTLIVHFYDTIQFDVPYAWTYEPVIMISRTIDERIDINLSHPTRPIEACENIARRLMQFVDENIDLPTE